MWYAMINLTWYLLRPRPYLTHVPQIKGVDIFQIVEYVLHFEFWTQYKYIYIFHNYMKYSLCMRVWALLFTTTWWILLLSFQADTLKLCNTAGHWCPDRRRFPWCNDTVDGKNPAKTSWCGKYPIICRVLCIPRWFDPEFSESVVAKRSEIWLSARRNNYTSQVVVSDFFHQQYSS